LGTAKAMKVFLQPGANWEVSKNESNNLFETLMA
jgi:hypothetical protein